MKTILYIATTNAGKLRDFKHAADAYGVSLHPLPRLTEIAAPVEDAATFDGNACIKAAAYSLHLPGQIVIADDSGLEVDALGGAPGVYSARYAVRERFPNPAAMPVDDCNNACLLARVARVTTMDRTARYRCVLAAARDGVIIATANGVVEGSILTAARGSGGFGYDPLFLLPALNQTMAEVDFETKLELSHRGLALRCLLAQLM